MEGSWVRRAGDSVQVSAIVLILALLLSPATALADDEAVVFNATTSDRLLGEVEMCRYELPMLRELSEKTFALDEVRVEREALLRERIVFLEKQQAELMKMNDQALQYGEMARKEAGGTWYQQALATGKWLGLGILLGLALGGL